MEEILVNETVSLAIFHILFLKRFIFYFRENERARGGGAEGEEEDPKQTLPGAQSLTWGLTPRSQDHNPETMAIAKTKSPTPNDCATQQPALFYILKLSQQTLKNYLT